MQLNLSSWTAIACYFAHCQKSSEVEKIDHPAHEVTLEMICARESRRVNWPRPSPKLVLRTLREQSRRHMDKTYFIHFINKNVGNSDIQIKIEKNITTANEIKFLGLIIGNKLSWKGHIDYITPKLNCACYCMRAVKPFVSHDTLKIIYYS
jgi:hypothetical protein